MIDPGLACARCGSRVSIVIARTSHRCGTCDGTKLVPINMDPASCPTVHTGGPGGPPSAGRRELRSDEALVGGAVVVRDLRPIEDQIADAREDEVFQEQLRRHFAEDRENLEHLADERG
jgi:hypothetical protein